MRHRPVRVCARCCKYLFSVGMSSKAKAPTSAKEASKNQRKTIHLDLKKIIKMHEEWKKENILAQEVGLAHSTISTIPKDQRGDGGMDPGMDPVVTRY